MAKGGGELCDMNTIERRGLLVKRALDWVKGEGANPTAYELWLLEQYVSAKLPLSYVLELLQGRASMDSLAVRCSVSLTYGLTRSLARSVSIAVGSAQARELKSS
jgi:hypothetical protein